MSSVPNVFPDLVRSHFVSTRKKTLCYVNAAQKLAQKELVRDEKLMPGKDRTGLPQCKERIQISLSTV